MLKVQQTPGTVDYTVDYTDAIDDMVLSDACLIDCMVAAIAVK